MLPAKRSAPSMVTPGRPTPTGIESSRLPDLTSRFTRREIEATIASGVEGTGVGTRSRSDVSRPVATSTTAALIPLPPTSIPMAYVPSTFADTSSVIDGLPIRRSEVVDGDATVDHERRAVGPARLIRREIDRHVDDL